MIQSIIAMNGNQELVEGHCLFFGRWTVRALQDELTGCHVQTE